MKILISVDIEGVAGVYHPEQTRPGNGEYERARLLMTEEANAAIAGAFDGGAEEVYVNDSHGSFRNMPPDRLDPRARVIQGKPRYLGMMSGVEHGVDGVFLIGYHSRGQGYGILAHTINSFAFSRIFMNDLELGEAGIYGALAGEYGVPVLMASGDDIFAGENHAFFPDTVFVETKTAGGAICGNSLSPEEACKAIRRAAEKALKHRHACRPFILQGPISVSIEAQSTRLADLFCQWPTMTRTGGNTLSFDTPTVEAAVRMINCLSAMSTMLR
ncbi:M55 family metallopeptidase [Allorhizobium sp. BGMRC 0089]|uniref:M55 family metallopeptidase n=1 Tax=Allorhizobium sonneratiae TaxID=2934936 RepID=UPI00203440BD|nr:M55 family metallopeptidase [Allorhizobium sonneratiae]MCM2294019.1 M55 family metallopeptidase [Allorhizobium sonneratiae]